MNASHIFDPQLETAETCMNSSIDFDKVRLNPLITVMGHNWIRLLNFNFEMHKSLIFLCDIDVASGLALPSYVLYFLIYKNIPTLEPSQEPDQNETVNDA